MEVAAVADADADAEWDEDLNELRAVQYVQASAGLEPLDLTMLGVVTDDVKTAGDLLALGLDLR